MKKLSKFIGFTAYALLAGSPAALSLDANLIGDWKCVINKPTGSWIMTWSVRDDGGYHTVITGPAILPSEDGKLQADNGKWSIRSTGNRADHGSYVITNDRLKLIGSKDTTEWIKQEAFDWKKQGTNGGASQNSLQHPISSKTAGTQNPALGGYIPGIMPERRLMEITAPTQRLDQSLAEGYFRKGMQLKDNDKWLAAAEAFSHALEARPDYIDAHYQRGVCLTNSDPADRNYSESFMRALPHAIRSAANVRFIAIGDFTHVIRAQPNNAKAWCMRGITEAQLMAFEAAAADLTKAIQIKPDYGYAYGWRALSKVHLNQDYSSDLAASARLQPDTQAYFANQIPEAKQLHAEMLEAERRRKEWVATHPVSSDGGGGSDRDEVFERIQQANSLDFWGQHERADMVRSGW